MRNGYRSEIIPRARRRRRLFWLVFGAAVLLVVLVGAGFYGLEHLTWFRVADFSVEGTSLSADEAVNAVKIAEIGGGLRAFLGPQNIIFWQLGGRPDVSLSLPLVKNVAVKTSFFSREVSITASDRELWGIICESGGARCYGLDASGTVFARVPDTEGTLIPKITDTNNRVLMLGEPFLPSSVWINNFFAVWNALEQNGYVVTGVTFDDLGTELWHATVSSGQTFDFNFSVPPDNFAGILAALKTKIDISKTQEIDFSVPQRIYYK